MIQIDEKEIQNKYSFSNHNLKSDEAMAFFEKLASEEEARQSEARKSKEEHEKREQMLAKRMAETKKSSASTDY